jgi:ParB-like chromosome segregation protein Spo0J
VIAHAVDKVAASIKEFGFRQPIVVDSGMVIIVGHVRHQAAQKLGLAKVPVHIAEGMTPEQAKAYRLADNRTGEDAQWDNELLALELDELDKLNFDKDILGFEPAELEKLQRSVEHLLDDGIDTEEARPIEEADTKATIGPYSFIIPRAQYLDWMEELKQAAGFEKEAVLQELKNRLGL